MKATIAAAALLLVLTGCASERAASEPAAGGTPTVTQPTGVAQAWWYDNRVYATNPAIKASAKAMVKSNPIPIARRLPSCVLPADAVAVPWPDGGGSVQCVIKGVTLTVRTYRSGPTPQEITAERGGQPAVVGDRFIVSFLGLNPAAGTATLPDQVVLRLGGRIAR